MANTIIITGGAGLIGNELASALSKRYNIVILDWKVPDICKTTSIKYIQENLLNIDNYKYRIKNITGVIHLAAVSRVIDAEKNPLLAWETNVGATQLLLSFLGSFEYPIWMIYGSSREVYGDPIHFPVSENHPLWPINRYGIGNVCAEDLVRRYSHQTRAFSVINRFSNVYGSINDQLDRVIPKFIIRALQDMPLELQGSQNVFDFTNISDTINALVAQVNILQNNTHTIMTDQQRQNNSHSVSLNICTSIGTTLQELANSIIDIIGSSSRIVFTNSRTYDVKKFIGDYSLASKLLNYYPKISLQQGLINLVSIIKNHYSDLINAGSSINTNTEFASLQKT